MNKSKIITSNMDAFAVLTDLDEDLGDNGLTNINEAKTFSVADTNAMEDAQKFREQDTADGDADTTLEVIDADADVVQHLKDKKSYVGQMILQCNSCKAPRFIDAYKLKANKADPDLYNEEDECPNCHNIGTGFSLIGQVGKHEDEAQADNNEASDEATFNNDQLEDSTEDENKPEETPTEDNNTEDVEKDEPESDTEWDDTDSEDDTVELPKLGEEYDPEDVSEDDTIDEDIDISRDEILTDPEDMDAEILQDQVDTVLNNSVEAKEIDSKDLQEGKGSAYELVYNEVAKYLDDNPLELADFGENANESDNIMDRIAKDLYDVDHYTDLEADQESAVKQAVMDYYSYLTQDESLEEALDLTTWDGSISNFLDAFVLDDNDLTVKVFNKNGTEVGTYTKEEIPFDVASLTVDTFNTDDNTIDLEVTKSSEDENSVTVSDLFSKYREDEHNTTTFLVTDVDTNDDSEIQTISELVDKFGDFVISNQIEVKSLNIYTTDTDVEDEVDELTDDEVEQLPDANESLIHSIIALNHLKDARISNPNSNESFIAESIRNHEDLDSVYEEFVRPLKDDQLTETFKNVTGYKDEVDEILERNGIKRSDFDYYLRNKDNKEPVQESVKKPYKQVKNRADLKAVVGNLVKNNIQYTVKKSLDENYRYDVYLTEAPLRFGNVPAVVDQPEQVSGEVVDRPEVTETGLVPPGMSDQDVELVTKINRIADDIKNAIHDSYGIDAPKNLIAADIIQDLQLVGGAKLVDDLENTPENQVTAELYRQFNGAWNDLDDLISFITGERITTSQADRLAHSLEALDGPNFTTEYIQQGIDSDQFLGMAVQGMVPYVDARQIAQNNPERVAALPQAHRRGRIAAYNPDADQRAQVRLAGGRQNQIGHKESLEDESTKDSVDEGKRIIHTTRTETYHYVLVYNNGDHDIYYNGRPESADTDGFEDELNYKVKVYNELQDAEKDIDDANEQWCKVCEVDDIDEFLEENGGFEPQEIIEDQDKVDDFSDFDECINNYFTENYDKHLTYISHNAEVNENKITISGELMTESQSKPVTFILTPNLEESIENKLTYDVTNDLSDEVIKYSIDK